MNKAQSVKLPNVAPVNFVKETVSELKKVTWPTRADTIKLTAMVIVLSVTVGLFIGGLDYAMIAISAIFFKR